jgi:hypothetical protein
VSKRFLPEGVGLLEKLAWGQDPAQVAQTVNPRLRGHINRGQMMMDQLPHLAQMGKDAWGGLKSVGNAVLSPASKVGPEALGAVGQAGSFLKKNPRYLGYGLTAAAVAPILMNAFSGSSQKNEDALMSAYQTPDRTITASLEEFLEKKAGMYGPSRPSGGIGGALRDFSRGASGGGDLPLGSASKAGPSNFSLSHDVGNKARSSFVDSFGGGIGAGVGKGLVDVIVDLLSMIGNAAHKGLIVEPKRRALLESIIRQDQVIHDAIQNHPDGQRLIAEAYGTMVKVAPTLSLDVNAVRSFLREAIIGGAGVNYATIKNLAETERAVSGYRNPPGQGGHS